MVDGNVCGDEPLDLVTNAGDSLVDLVGGGLGGVRSDLVGDLCEGGMSVRAVDEGER